MGGPAVLAFPLMDIHVYHLPSFYVSETDVRDGCQRRMMETDDGDG